MASKSPTIPPPGPPPPQWSPPEQHWSQQQQWTPQQAPPPPPGQGEGQWVWAPAPSTSQTEQQWQAGPSNQQQQWGPSPTPSQEKSEPQADEKSTPLEKQLYRSTTPTEPLPEPPAYTDADASALFSPPHPAPAAAQLTPLARPVCLPQTMSGFDAPFSRAHGPDIEAAGVREDDWLAFLDALNIAMAASPPLRIVDMIGYAIGFVPNGYTFMASIFLRQTSQAGMHKLQKTLTDRLLEHANVTFFEPRGLKVRLMKTAAMRRFAGLDRPGSRGMEQLSGIASNGMQIVQSIPIFGKIAGQLAGKVGEMVNPSGPNPVNQRGPANGFAAPAIIQKTPVAGQTNRVILPDPITGTRLNDLAGYISPICFDVPPAYAPENMLDRLIAMAEATGQAPVVNHKPDQSGLRQLMGRVVDTTGNRSKMKGVNMKNVKSLKKMKKQVQKANKNTKKNPGNQQNQGPARRNGKTDAQEMSSTNDLVWVVLFNKEHDTEIGNRQFADNMQDGQYNAQQWQDEMRRETQDNPAGLQYRPYQPPPRASSRQILLQR